MSDSSEPQFVIDDADEKEKKNLKKGKLIRAAESLRLTPTEEELEYRKSLEDVDILTEFSNSVKCTKCQKNFKNSILEGKCIYSHPLLDVLMCKSCCLFYGNGDFSLDEDKEDKYCRWCGEGGRLFLCAKCICGFCPSCIKRHFGGEKVKEIRQDDDWICYFCNPKPLWNLRAICSLAKKQSEENKKQKVNEDNIQSTVNSSTKTLKRKARRRLQNSKESVAKDDCRFLNSCSDSSLSSDQRIVKKRRITRSLTLGKNSKRSGKKAQYNDISRSSRLYSNDSSSSDETSGETNAKLSRSNEDLNNSRAKERNIEKLKQILKVAETTSELCLTMCQKKIKKFGRKNCVMSDEKLMTECEKLKSLIILMSSSLSTVHNLIISLQQKCGNKAKRISLYQINADNIRYDNIIGYINVMGKQIEKHCSEGQALKESLAALRECFDSGKNLPLQSKVNEGSQEPEERHSGCGDTAPQDTPAAETCENAEETSTVQKEQEEEKDPDSRMAETVQESPDGEAAVATPPEDVETQENGTDGKGPPDAEAE